MGFPHLETQARVSEGIMDSSEIGQAWQAVGNAKKENEREHAVWKENKKIRLPKCIATVIAMPTEDASKSAVKCLGELYTGLANSKGGVGR